MKSTWFANRQRYDFARCLQDADRHQHSWELMRLFLQCALGAMRQGARMAVGLPKDEAIEQAVIAAQKKCKHPEKFTECFGILVSALEGNPHDFLGSTISELGQNDSKWSGQCFTPSELCQVIAQLSMSEAKPDPGRRLMLSEPACGGGAMVIAASRVLMDNGFCPWNYYWVCTDVDWRMFACCYVQASLLGIPATVMHGNTISLEQWDSAVTFAAALHPIRDTVARDTVSQILDMESNQDCNQESKEDESHHERPAGQLMLF